jgi:hypothetical protein
MPVRATVKSCCYLTWLYLVFKSGSVVQIMLLLLEMRGGDLILIPRECLSSVRVLPSQVDCFKLHSTSICQVRLDHLSRWRTTGFPLSFRGGWDREEEKRFSYWADLKERSVPYQLTVTHPTRRLYEKMSWKLNTYPHVVSRIHRPIRNMVGNLHVSLT